MKIVWMLVYLIALIYEAICPMGGGIMKRVPQKKQKSLSWFDCSGSQISRQEPDELRNYTPAIKTEGARVALRQDSSRIRSLVPTVCFLVPDCYTRDIVGKILHSDELDEQDLASCKKHWERMCQRAEGVFMLNMFMLLHQESELFADQRKVLFSQLRTLKEYALQVCEKLEGYDDFCNKLHAEHALLHSYIRRIKRLVFEHKEEAYKYINQDDGCAVWARYYAENADKMRGEELSSSMFIGRELFPHTSFVIADFYIKNLYEILFAPFQLKAVLLEHDKNEKQNQGDYEYFCAWQFDEKFEAQLDTIEEVLYEVIENTFFSWHIYYMLHIREIYCQEARQVLSWFDVFSETICLLHKEINFDQYPDHLNVMKLFKKDLLADKELINAILKREEILHGQRKISA